MTTAPDQGYHPLVQGHGHLGSSWQVVERILALRLPSPSNDSAGRLLPEVAAVVEDGCGRTALPITSSSMRVTLPTCHHRQQPLPTQFFDHASA